LALPAFKSGRRCATHFSKENCSSENYSPALKTGKVSPFRFLKALGATPRNLLSNKSKEFGLTVLERVLQIQKLYP
jgi:hypothetical protein